MNLDRVPAEVRGLIDRCLAKDPGQRPAARDLMFAAGAIPPTERWVPAPVTRSFTELPVGQDGSRTVTSARLSPVSQPAPGRQQGREQGRRQPLAIASVVVGILAASAAGGIAVAGCTSQTVGVHSVSSPITSAPTTSAPSTSPTAIVAPSTSRVRHTDRVRNCRPDRDHDRDPDGIPDRNRDRNPDGDRDRDRDRNRHPDRHHDRDRDCGPGALRRIAARPDARFSA